MTLRAGRPARPPPSCRPSATARPGRPSACPASRGAVQRCPSSPRPGQAGRPDSRATPPARPAVMRVPPVPRRTLYAMPCAAIHRSIDAAPGAQRTALSPANDASCHTRLTGGLLRSLRPMLVADCISSAGTTARGGHARRRVRLRSRGKAARAASALSNAALPAQRASRRRPRRSGDPAASPGAVAGGRLARRSSERGHGRGCGVDAPPGWRRAADRLCGRRRRGTRLCSAGTTAGSCRAPWAEPVLRLPPAPGQGWAADPWSASVAPARGVDAVVAAPVCASGWPG